MAERFSWAVSSTPDGLITTEDGRLAFGAAWLPGATPVSTRGGFRPAAGTPGAVTASSPTTDTHVHIAAFQYVLPSTRGPGPYILTNDSSIDMDILGPNPADPTNQRNDLIIARQNDAFYGIDANSAMNVLYIKGTPSGTPTDPSLAAFPDYTPLARVRVGATASKITSTMIDDLRDPKFAVAVGGLLPVANAAERNAIVAYRGMPIWRSDRAWIEVHDGVAWRVQGTAIASSLTDLSTAVSNPVAGQVGTATDTGFDYRYNGSAWQTKPGTVVSGQYRNDNSASTAGTAESVVVTATATTLDANSLYSVTFFCRTASPSSAGTTCKYTIRANSTAGAILSAGAATTESPTLSSPNLVIITAKYPTGSVTELTGFVGTIARGATGAGNFVANAGTEITVTKIGTNTAIGVT
jgi:hypothetical protein